MSGRRDKQLELWDRATGRERRSFAGPGGVITALADGHGALVAGCIEGCRAWDLVIGQAGRALVLPPGTVGAVAVTPDGRHALVAAHATLAVCDLATGVLRRTRTRHNDPVLAVAVAPDGRTIVSGGEDGTVRAWRLPAGVLAPDPL